MCVVYILKKHKYSCDSGADRCDKQIQKLQLGVRLLVYLVDVSASSHAGASWLYCKIL